MELSASPSTTVADATVVPRTAVRGLAAVLGMLVLIFAGTVYLRAPWFGHLARGDSWVTGQALRFTRTWYDGDLWSLRGRFVTSPPTAEFDGGREQRKFGLPGWVLLAYGILKPLGLEPTVARLMWINLGLHLLTALLLAVVAWCMARVAWPEHDVAPPLVALHCGAFVLLLPSLLYWGQNLCINDFLAVPLLAFVVAARWLRSEVTAGWRRVTLDVAVALCVAAGTLTEFVFWMLVPYLLIVGRRRARAGDPNTTDRAWLTVALPFAIVVPPLTFVILVQGTLGYMIGRGGAWLVGDTSGAGGVLAMIILRPALLGSFLVGHFGDAFGIVGFTALGLGLLRLLRRDRLPGLPPVVRGILVDLLAPCLIMTFLLAAHASMHTFAAMKFVPFVALAWTVLVPFVIARSRAGARTLLAPVYGVVALLVLSPLTSAYPDYFPAPEPFWERQGDFLREHTLRTDMVFSPTTEIELVPPQPIALAQRRVAHVYGPLDVFIGPVDGTSRKLGYLWWPPVKLDTTMALYGPPTLYRKFGADGAPVVTEGDLSLVRMPVRQLADFLASRPDANVRRRLLDVLGGGLRPTGDLRPRTLAVGPLHPPVAMHLIQGLDATLVYDRLYWADPRHFHWKSSELEFVVRGKERYQSQWGGFWMPVPEVPDARGSEWGKLVTGLFRRAADDTAGRRAILVVGLRRDRDAGRRGPRGAASGGARGRELGGVSDLQGREARGGGDGTGAWCGRERQPQLGLHPVRRAGRRRRRAGRGLRAVAGPRPCGRHRRGESADG